MVLFITLGISNCKKEDVILEGNVLESYKNTPLSKIKVNISNKRAETDESGHFKIEGLKKGVVEINLQDPAGKYEEFKDKLVLDIGVNYRDFFLDAKHPLNIPTSDIIEPTSYAYNIFIGLSPDKPLATADVEVSSLESALHIVGKEFDPSGKISDIEIIQIGTTFWVRDKYGTWNILQNPGESVFRINSIFNEKYTPAINFYRNPDITYEDAKEEIAINGVKTHKFLATFKEEESGFVDNLEIYVITEGKNKGRIMRIISSSPMHSMYPYVQITLSKHDEDIVIQPPIITQ